MNVKSNIYFNLKDTCRKGLLPYLESAFSNIPDISNPEILDIGCGTGVPTLWMAAHLKGSVTAIDIQKEPLQFLEQKVKAGQLQSRVKTICSSFPDYPFQPESFDIILAEGYLNIVGFEKGFVSIISKLKKGGYFIIHDEFRDHERKCAFIYANRCTIAETLFLDHNVWWDSYYSRLEKEINMITDDDIRHLSETDLKELEFYRTTPDLFQSIYYIIENIPPRRK
jgi:cyclopropane fatty-acyl-phospholipid synthase-like methyltransferase